jgi:hypothetical protein
MKKKKEGERSMSDGPYMWANKSALHRVLNNSGGETSNTICLHVYLALCWIASDQQSDTFTVKSSYIAQRAGYRYRSTFDALKDLERLKLIHISRTKKSMKAPSTYTVLPFCTTRRTLCTSRQPSGADSVEAPKGANTDKPPLLGGGHEGPPPMGGKGDGAGGQPRSF